MRENRIDVQSGGKQMSIHDLKFLEDQLDELKQQGVYR